MTEDTLRTTIQQAVIALSATIMAALALITLLAIVIAPACTGITEIANAYRIASLCIFLPAFQMLVWRRQSMVASVAVPVLQAVSGILFATWLNSLPLSCSP